MMSIARSSRQGIWLVSAFVAFVFALLPISSAVANSLPARAQFWDGVGFSGDKLDKDVENWVPATASRAAQGYVEVSDLSRVGHSCFVGCSGRWDNQIRSLTTTGGGQNPVELIVYDDTNTDLGQGSCLYVHSYMELRDLSNVVVIPANGSPATSRTATT